MHRGMLSVGLMVGVRLATAFAIMKYISWLFGPEDFGILVHIIGTAAIFYSFSGTSLVNGVTTVVAANEGEEARDEWLRVAMRISLVISLAVAAVLFLLFLLGSSFVFDRPGIAPVLLLIASAQFVVGFGNVALSFLVGVGEMKTFIAANIAGSIIAALGVVLIAAFFGYDGAIYAVATLPLAPALLALIWLWRRGTGRSFGWTRSDPTKVRLLLRHSAATLLAIASLPTAQFLLRMDVAERWGWEAVGYWQAVARLSDAYMQVFGVLFVNFLLPTLTRLTSRTARLQSFVRSGGAIVLLFLLGALVFSTFRGVVIELAYSSAFLPSTVYVLPQLVGDFARVLALMIVYYLIASGRIWTLGIAEFSYGVVLLIAYQLMAPRYGALAAVLAHVVSSVILFVVMVALWIDSLRRNHVRV